MTDDETCKCFSCSVIVSVSRGLRPMVYLVQLFPSSAYCALRLSHTAPAFPQNLSSAKWGVFGWDWVSTPLCCFRFASLFRAILPRIAVCNVMLELSRSRLASTCPTSASGLNGARATLASSSTCSSSLVLFSPVFASFSLSLFALSSSSSEHCIFAAVLSAHGDASTSPSAAANPSRRPQGSSSAGDSTPRETPSVKGVLNTCRYKSTLRGTSMVERRAWFPRTCLSAASSLTKHVSPSHSMRPFCTA
mmetsp:Transcript_50145/g.118113  ORF Transcript_50145/g.118113 Transcript_50145/m.118113 type:complete len:249 (-) Transcript_50145:577-1323(-)